MKLLKNKLNYLKNPFKNPFKTSIIYIDKIQSLKINKIILKLLILIKNIHPIIFIFIRYFITIILHFKKKHINPNKVLIVNKKVNYVISNENINKIYYIFINDKKYKSIFTLIDIVRHLYDLDFKNTLIKLDNVSEFNFIKNNQLNILKNKIENNLDYVNSLIEHPVYRKIIVNIKDTIETINRIELGIYNDISRNKEGDHYFFISQDKLSKIINKSRGIAGKHLNMMVFLGLLNKLEYSDIPKKSLLRINKKNNFKNISFYSIPNYKEKKDIIEMYLFLAKSKKITLNNLTTKKLINDLDIEEEYEDLPF